jgi:serine/threonine-protein kinase
MFKFFRRASKTAGQVSNQRQPSAKEVLPGALKEGDQVKKCPKCHQYFLANTVICKYDSTLLMLLRYEQPLPAQSITATRADGSKWSLLCENHLGCGSICDVFAALDTSTGRKYAIKVLHEKLMSDEKSVRKFLDGAKLPLVLNHENVICTHATGNPKEQNYSKARPFIVCDIVEGQQLSKLIDKHDLPSATDTLAIAGGICAALAHAHEQGIVHGDLKPSNIYLVSDGEKVIAKVCDFAVAERLFQGLEWNQISTMTTSIYGCAAYLAPDFIDVRNASAASDIYSLGCIMYECLTGSPPFTGANDFVTILMHRDTAPKPFSADYTPKAVADIVMKALDKDPRQRWQSAAEMREAIAKL